MKFIRLMLVAVMLVPIIVISHAVATEGWNLATTIVVTMLLVVALVLIMAVRRHAHTHVFRCDVCREVFSITAWTDFLSPHYPNKKRLTCPKCGEVSWCHELDRRALTMERAE